MPIDGESCLFEVHRHLDEDHVRAITLQATALRQEEITEQIEIILRQYRHRR